MSVFSQHLSRVGLYSFSLFIWLNPPLAYLGLGLILLAFLADIRSAWALLRRQPMFYLLALLALYIVARAWLATQEFPETAALQYVATHEWLLLLLFILVSWALKADPVRMHTVMLLALASLFLSILTSVDWGAIDRVLSHRLVGLRIHVIQLGLFSATGILGLLVYAGQLWGKRSAGLLFYVRLLLWALALGFLFEVLLLSESRASWFAALLVLSVTGYLLTRNRLRRSVDSKVPTYLLPLLALVAFLTVLLLSNFDTVHKRLALTGKVVNVIQDTPVDKFPHSSIGERVRLACLAYDAWKERPLFGWGTGTSRYLIEHRMADYVDGKVTMHPHLHNLFLEILVRFGLAGLAIFLLIFWLILKPLFVGAKSAAVRREDFYFIVGSLSILVIWSCSDYLVMKMHGRFFWIYLLGLAFSYPLYRARSVSQEGHNDTGIARVTDM